jgi:hypothetical protein
MKVEQGPLRGCDPEWGSRAETTTVEPYVRFRGEVA